MKRSLLPIFILLITTLPSLITFVVNPDIKIVGISNFASLGSNSETLIIVETTSITNESDQSININQILSADFMEDSVKEFTSIDCFEGTTKCIVGTTAQTSVYLEIANLGDSDDYTNFRLFKFDNSTIGGDSKIPPTAAAVQKILTLETSNYFIAAHHQRGFLRWDITNTVSFVQYIPVGFADLKDLIHINDSKYIFYSSTNAPATVFSFDVTRMKKSRQLDVTGGAEQINFVAHTDYPKNNVIIAVQSRRLNFLDFAGLGAQLGAHTFSSDITNISVFEFSDFIATVHQSEGAVKFSKVVLEGDGSITVTEALAHTVAGPKLIQYSHHFGNMILHSSDVISIFEISYAPGFESPACNNAGTIQFSFTNFGCQQCAASVTKVGEYCDASTVVGVEGGVQTFSSLTGTEINGSGWLPKPSELSDSTRSGDLVGALIVTFMILLEVF